VLQAANSWLREATSEARKRASSGCLAPYCVKSASIGEPSGNSAESSAWPTISFSLPKNSTFTRALCVPPVMTLIPAFYRAQWYRAIGWAVNANRRQRSEAFGVFARRERFEAFFNLTAHRSLRSVLQSRTRAASANAPETAMKILVTGSTGLVGTALLPALAKAGHTVCRLVRPGTIVTPGTHDGFQVVWNPATGELGGAAVGADAVVNLAGASVADGRWTPARKTELRSSRVDTTRALVSALAKMSARPRVLVSASATGFYGNRGDEILTEESQAGTDFLAEMAKAWEAEAIKAEALGIRVVLARLGVVLARQGGALPQMMRPFRFFVGGKIGSGQQWMSWITLDDVVAALHFALENGNVRGPINLISPQPVQNTDFTKALAHALHRPALFPAPVFALRLALGEMADALLLASQRVLPQKLQQLGFQFRQPDLGAALAAVLSSA